VRWKFVLAKVLAVKINQHRQKAADQRYQETLFGAQASVETSFTFQFDFKQMGYAPHWNYLGHPYQFERHYYAAVGELKNKGEEYECKKALDMVGGVKHWVRNLDRRGFWLPLAERKFYPDFVAELEDGRILVVEHKGEIYATNDDSKENATSEPFGKKKAAERCFF
jgi:type III restriction enzyme